MEREGDAEKLASSLLGEKLAACISFFQVRSLYWWKGKIERAQEFLLIIKTADELMDRLIEYLTGIHPYDVPEIVVLPVERVWEAYERWLRDVTLR
ncbi:MAG: divalent-cation tolerance protein CutA [Candidatus Korarchaeota archaeon]|nr:divalent-cation tolerance protein CutA [Candidatus Korarchaeota archaeon]